MEQEKNINDFDFNLICDYFSSLERQGPGSEEVTKKALSFIGNLHHGMKIADIGCGTGGQTITLAQNTDAHITGIDLFPNFIGKLDDKIKQSGYQGRMKAVVGSMMELPFSENEFDVIWSEGAIYNIGFQRGLNEWRKYIKQGGYIAVSEVSWFTEERPAEIEEFWNEAYAEIGTIPNKIRQMQESGYIPTAHFILPVSCWTDDFYAPMPPVMEAFLEKCNYNKTAVEFIDNQKKEIEIYHKYNKYYGYVFYIGQKI